MGTHNYVPSSRLRRRQAKCSAPRSFTLRHVGLSCVSPGSAKATSNQLLICTFPDELAPSLMHGLLQSVGVNLELPLRTR
jgi:hypothetical protein